MRTFSYRLVNVFAESIFGGNPLCVFEDGANLTDTEMQALALQFNLSETTFVLPSATATKRVRIFTPTFEMAFAGHPTLGSAHVVRDLARAGNDVTLEMKAGVIPVHANGDRWTLRANTPTSREVEKTREFIAMMLGLHESDLGNALGHDPRWVDTGSEQLIIPLASADAVRRAKPNPVMLTGLSSNIGRSMAYVFAENGAPAESKLLSRFFFLKYGAVIEDPGTGAATANLGGYLLHGKHAPCAFQIEQGEAVGRPCHLGLAVSAAGEVTVSGNVIEIARGTVTLP